MYTDARVVHPYKPNDTVTLEELNEELVRLHIPAIIFVIVSIIVGIIGNTLVLLVYKKKFRRSNHRYFILFLAFIDLLACTTGMPFLIVSLRLPYLMTSSLACKINRYSHYLVNNSSGLLLLVISAERYHKICQPHKKQLKTRQILYVCYGTLLFSAIIAIPAPIFFEASEIDTKIGNLTGLECYVSHAVKESVLFEMYLGCLLIESIICIIVIVILYILIIKRVWSSDQFKNAMRFNTTMRNTDTSDSTSQPNDDCTVSECSSQRMSRQSGDTAISLLKTVHALQRIAPSSGNSPLTKSHSCHVVSNGKVHGDLLPPSEPNSVSSSREHLPKKTVKRAISDIYLNKLRTPDKLTNKPSADSARKARGSRATIRVTFMLFAVSIVFVFAFVPHLVLMIVTVEVEGFLESLNAIQVVVYQVFLRIFIINNIANPIIYFIFDSKFRQACKTLIFCENCRNVNKTN